MLTLLIYYFCQEQGKINEYRAISHRHILYTLEVLFKRFTGLNQFNSTPFTPEPFDFDVAKNATRKDCCTATRLDVMFSLRQKLTTTQKASRQRP